jgi:hypothetical protein
MEDLVVTSVDTGTERDANIPEFLVHWINYCIETLLDVDKKRAGNRRYHIDLRVGDVENPTLSTLVTDDAVDIRGKSWIVNTYYGYLPVSGRDPVTGDYSQDKLPGCIGSLVQQMVDKVPHFSIDSDELVDMLPGFFRKGFQDDLEKMKSGGFNSVLDDFLPEINELFMAEPVKEDTPETSGRKIRVGIGDMDMSQKPFVTGIISSELIAFINRCLVGMECGYGGDFDYYILSFAPSPLVKLPAITTMELREPMMNSLAIQVWLPMQGSLDAKEYAYQAEEFVDHVLFSLDIIKKLIPVIKVDTTELARKIRAVGLSDKRFRPRPNAGDGDNLFTDFPGLVDYANMPMDEFMDFLGGWLKKEMQGGKKNPGRKKK